MRYDIHYNCNEVLEYLRKSRSDDPALSVEEVLSKHEHILKDYAEKHLDGAVPEQNIFREVASSETIDGRPEFLKLLKAVESPRIKAVLVVEVQRLSRGDLEDAGRLIKLLRYTDTAVITPHKTYDLSDEYDRDFFERELKRGNEYLEYFKKIQARGRLESVKEGNFLGNKPPYGYDKTWVTVNKKKCPTLIENKEQADVVRMIFDMYVNQGLGVTVIGHRLDELNIKAPSGQHWSSASIRDMLSNIHYIGKVRWEWRKTVYIVEDQEVRQSRPRFDNYLVCDGKHEGIISEELYNAAQQKKGRNTRVKKDSRIRNPLAGLIYCPCGHSMVYKSFLKPDGTCRSAPRLSCYDQAHCGNGSVLYDEMQDQVRRILENSIREFEIKLRSEESDTKKLHAKMVHRLEEQKKKLEQKELKQWDMYSMGEMPKAIFDKLNQAVKKEKKENEDALRRAYETMPDPVDYREKIIRFQDALKVLNDPDSSAEVKNNYLKRVIDRIICTRQKPVRISRNNCTIYGLDSKNLGVGGRWYSPPMELEVHLVM